MNTESVTKKVFETQKWKTPPVRHSDLKEGTHVYIFNKLSKPNAPDEYVYSGHYKIFRILEDEIYKQKKYDDYTFKIYATTMIIVKQNKLQTVTAYSKEWE